MPVPVLSSMNICVRIMLLPESALRAMLGGSVLLNWRIKFSVPSTKLSRSIVPLRQIAVSPISSLIEKVYEV